VEVSQEIASGVCLLWAGSSLFTASLSGILAHLLLVCLVELHHTSSSKVESKCGSKESEKSDLDGGVVEDLVLSTLWILVISVLKLSPYSAVSGRNGDTTSENTTGLEHNGTSDPGKSAVDERGSCWTNVLVGLWVDTGEAGKHRNVWDLDFVEEEETVVHGAVRLLIIFNHGGVSTYL